MRALPLVLLALAAPLAAQHPPNPRQQPAGTVQIFAPEQHDLYDGHFVMSAGRIYMVGGLNDADGWDHLDNDARAVHPVDGTAEIDVDEIHNTGTFEARAERRTPQRSRSTPMSAARNRTRTTDPTARCSRTSSAWRSPGSRTLEVGAGSFATRSSATELR